MATKIFVNLPVKNLDASIAFFTQLGYTFNPQFTNEKATCMIISDDIYVMLLVEEFFQSFIPTQIADTSTTTESIICLSADSKQQVDEMISKAVAAGATTYRDPQDHGFMYGHSYRDLDGHLWEIMWMDVNAVPQAGHVESSAVA
jgi:uncharacterized protein